MNWESWTFPTADTAPPKVTITGTVTPGSVRGTLVQNLVKVASEPTDSDVSNNEASNAYLIPGPSGGATSRPAVAPSSGDAARTPGYLAPVTAGVFVFGALAGLILVRRRQPGTRRVTDRTPGPMQQVDNRHRGPVRGADDEPSNAVHTGSTAGGPAGGPAGRPGHDDGHHGQCRSATGGRRSAALAAGPAPAAGPERDRAGAAAAHREPATATASANHPADRSRPDFPACRGCRCCPVSPVSPGHPAPRRAVGPAATAGPGAGGTGSDAVDPAGVVTADDAAAIIANDPAADLYPQPPVDPVTTAQSRLVARLGEVQHRVQYLRNVLTRTRADLAVAAGQLDAPAMLITLLTATGRRAGTVAAARSTARRTGSSRCPRRSPPARPNWRAASRRYGRCNSRSTAASQTTLASSAPTPAAATNYGGGKLRRPVPGRVGSPFGNRFDPVYHVWQLHAGVDMAAASGTAIVAAADGRVTRAGWAGGYGNYTCIDHGQFDGQRLTTCYAHQSAILVRPGQQVSAGQVIGRVGSTGASTGPHLHFEVRLGGRPVDPVPWI